MQSASLQDTEYANINLQFSIQNYLSIITEVTTESTAVGCTHDWQYFIYKAMTADWHFSTENAHSVKNWLCQGD